MRRVGVISAIDNFLVARMLFGKKKHDDRNKKPKIKQIRIKKNNTFLKNLSQ